jgi:hypothetical protein
MSNSAPYVALVYRDGVWIDLGGTMTVEESTHAVLAELRRHQVRVGDYGVVKTRGGRSIVSYSVEIVSLQHQQPATVRRVGSDQGAQRERAAAADQFHKRKRSRR